MSSSLISSGRVEKEERRNEGYKIACTSKGCNQKFSSAGELAIHKQKHQMTLKLGPPRSALAEMLPYSIDQTPTPTKFLQAGKEMGLFDEIGNPFDNEFKWNVSRGESLKEKARRSAVPGLIINNQITKVRTPTSYPSSNSSLAQPVHVITLTPTLPSPVISGSQFFIPPMPSPQGFLQSPALISPSIVPFSASGLPFPTVQAVVEAQHAAITQAFMNAAAAANNNVTQPMSCLQREDSNPSQGHMMASRTSSMDFPNTAAASFPTQNVSIPVNNNPTPPSCHAMPVGQNMASAPVGSASVIQQHGQISMEQRRPLSQSNSLDHPIQPMPSIMDRKPSFHGETSVITQAPAHSSEAQMNVNMNMHLAHPGGYPYMVSQSTSVPPFSQLTADVSGRMASYSALTASQSDSTPSQRMQHHPHSLTHQNSLPLNRDAKQKLKETLTSNNPGLHIELSTSLHQQQQQFSIKQEEENIQNEVSSSSSQEIAKTPGRRRSRQTEMDPDRKRMRFLERNRAAASRCRAKKKEWVSGLEVKAKDLSSSNIGLQNEVATLREEVASLKQLLLAHRDCPITRVQQQKLAIAGGDPSAVVSDPVQAAASLRGITIEECDEGSDDDSLLPLQEEDSMMSSDNLHLDLTNTASNGSISDVGQVASSAPLQASVLVNARHACEVEQATQGFPEIVPQVATTSAIVLNSNYIGVSSALATASLT